jgi:beta-galactosidase
MNRCHTQIPLLLAMLLVICLSALTPGGICAQNVLTIDATAAVPAPVPVAAKLGSSRNPQGQVIGVNSRYLTFDGKPWLPVMGEFHYSRYPEAEWEQEILKMKAAGVQIVSTYVIWIHQEQHEGVFDWSGQRDLHSFVELCGKHGMYVFVRIGPWSHAETRNGGLPDWVLKNSPVRENNPVYLREVQTFYSAIGKQLNGMLWKDGGPVIGIQIENEYNARGPGKGDAHIRKLKAMAIADGMDVPLYTVTGWDGAAIPLDAVLPVFGGYPAAPWSGTAKKLPPSEIYAFRFHNRAAGSMGAIGGSGQNPASAYRGTPFLTAEIGAGAEDTYFRRPVLSANDIAAIAPVMLGSGVNLLGYYMFHGGRNPDGGDETLQESQRTGFPTDVPVRSYDFQAPIGAFGQERESFRKLKIVHYFLNDFGSILAPMTPRIPDKVPSSPADTSVPRVAARTMGDSGFLFLNNYVRGLRMPDRPGFQIALKLPSGTLNVPQQPIDLPSGAYGIWPVNFPLTNPSRVRGDAQTIVLHYSTAQLFKHIQIGHQSYFFFAAIPGIVPEFLLANVFKVEAASRQIDSMTTAGGLRLRMDASATVQVRLSGGIHLVLLPEHLAEQVWRVGNPALLLSTSSSVFYDKDDWTLQSIGDPNFSFGVFGTRQTPSSSIVKVAADGSDGVFSNYSVRVPAVELHVRVSKVRAATPRAPWKMGSSLSWRPQPVPLAPDAAEFSGSALWNIDLSPIPETPAVSDVFLELKYQGDVARLSRGGTLLDDNFWNGDSWLVGLKELDGDWRNVNRRLTMAILPLPRRFPMYLQKTSELRFNAEGIADSLTDVRAVAQYQLVLHAPVAP